MPITLSVLLGQRFDIQAELEIIVQDVSLGISHQRATATDNTWLIWERFCHDLNIDPTLQDAPD
jgi:hypothetical protein